MTTKRTAEFGISKNGKTCVVSWVRNHASLQLSQKLPWIHSARLGEALAPGAILPVFARLEKPVDCPDNNQSNRRQRLPDYAVWEIHTVMKLAFGPLGAAR